MKKFTEEEFRDRMGALERAGRIFPDVLNISDRFKIYQEVLAEQERTVHLSTQAQGHKPRTIMDKYVKPRCPECGFEMNFRQVPENPDGVEVQLVCSNPEHTGKGSVLDSLNDLQWWSENLELKDGPTGTP
jgi:hypothetical protein